MLLPVDPEVRKLTRDHATAPSGGVSRPGAHHRGVREVSRVERRRRVREVGGRGRDSGPRSGFDGDAGTARGVSRLADEARPGRRG